MRNGDVTPIWFLHGLKISCLNESVGAELPDSWHVLSGASMKSVSTLSHAAMIAVSCLAVLAQEKPQKPVIDWHPGPITAQIGDSAEIVVPEGFLFTDKKGTQKLL